MASSKLTISRCILYIAIFVERAAAVDLVELLAVDCRPSNNFTAGSKYQNELNIVLNYLQRATPATGFAFEYVGEAKTGSGIYGRALCRGDISATECKTCIDAAITELRQNCTFRKVAGAWYEGCFVKYSNQDIYSKLDRGSCFRKEKLRSHNHQKLCTGWFSVLWIFPRLIARLALVS
ncbi:cysteine-rich repeat secretory protein 38-like [Coffea arabica]|uniref:Cysteine-rich repeat secretory protein 38-like n=1 Tax=Coffea arabica TaxID=13443 RepID=A0A6P6UH95_COFAR|nr:cysteine-rich repeat secretory protein 38-like [Coffea arabica]